jgi:hypothetical protein
MIFGRRRIIARRRLGAVDFSLLPTFAFVLGPLTLLDFATSLLERVLILCQAACPQGWIGPVPARKNRTGASIARTLAAQKKCTAMRHA